jgi:hypothetical protein
MRARNIKPGFFKNEDLADLGPYAQLLFVGLWQIADKGGKLEDRPRRIKAEIFPYYEIKPSIETLLNHLTERHFLIRYKAGGVKLIKIANFEKHQSPHHTEKLSTYPDPCTSPLITSDSPSNNGELTVNPPLQNGEYPPDSLIHGFTDSPNTDSLIPDKKPRPPKKSETPFPDDFSISDAVRTWATGKGFDRLEDHLEAFKDYALSRGKLYADWDSAFKRSIREDWAKLKGNGSLPQRQGSTTMSKADQVTAGNLAARERVLEKYREKGE